MIERDGFAVMERLLDVDAVTSLLDSFFHHERSSIPTSAEILYTHAPPPPNTPGMERLMHQWLNPHRRPPPLSTRAVAAHVRPTVEALLGEPAVLFQDVLMDKGDEQGPFPWHQDYPFWPVDEPRGVVVWAPLDPVDELSGGLSLAIGSHHSGIGPAIDLHTGGAQSGSTGVPIDPARYEAHHARLDPGDAIVFHPLTWHASQPNRSGRRRRVWASTWLARSARFSHANAPRHPLCKLTRDGAFVGSLEGEF
ncbi:phytanoyl-CoA dioxygenase family protein [Polyangium sp. 6x1]|uniref:phytanoyl-CoA dioxygenase family protein n=1 Tax=Polyangium sp. 6x1 TaxID=3042689 RepID=UPI002482F651|nr:phytanoyl-CoA dioxygenase family protein [Polyangium sp. 6x1]MDI1443609.1 phytanoyl-CoA dioxygenase family protein [Polyangium sp. 6x1]